MTHNMRWQEQLEYIMGKIRQVQQIKHLFYVNNSETSPAILKNKGVKK
jgi:hypothetical protein